jgi:predicted small lipoprotein YifL
MQMRIFLFLLAALPVVLFLTACGGKGGGGY